MPGILSQEELERRRKILGMLGSDHDGEVLAAVKQLRKAAAARKLTLVEYILDGTSVAVSPTYVPQPPPYSPRPPPPPATGEAAFKPYIRKLSALDEQLDILTAWESEFCYDIVNYDHVTIKQKAAIRKILTKYRQYLGPVDW